MIKRLIEFITNGIWEASESDMTQRKVKWFLRPFKVVVYTALGLGEHNLVLRSAALTFYTLMSIVPVMALIFAIVKGFGFDAAFTENLYAEFPDHTFIIDTVLEFADNLLHKTKSSIIALVGFIVLLWSVIKVFINIENAFNNIWEIKKSRSMARKFSDYITVIFFSPILWLSSASISQYIKNSISTLPLAWLLNFFYALASFAIVWLMFALIYYVMPNTRVKFRSALISGIIAGTAFQIFQAFYVYIQSEVSSYNAIYGSFAALPLFLVWLQASWQILLFGAELSFAYQNLKKFEQERDSVLIPLDDKRKVLIATMTTIVKHFINNQGPVNSESLATELDLPIRIVRDVIFELESAELVVAVKTEGDDKVNFYIPARDIHAITVMDVVNSVENVGYSKLNIDSMSEMREVCNVMDTLRKASEESPMNVHITELIK